MQTEKAALKFTDQDHLALEFTELQESIKAMTTRLEEIKDIFKDKGSFSTRYFVIAVDEQSRTGMAPINEVTKVIPKEELERLNLIRTSTFKVVKVSPKG